MPSSNDSLWLAYAVAIKNEANVSTGGDKALYISAHAQPAPWKGNQIPEEYTNNGVYQVANAPLSTDNLFYDPSSDHGFIQNVQNYLLNVEIKGNSNPGLQQMIEDSRRDVTQANAAYVKSLEQAIHRFQEESSAGFTDGQSFQDWVNTNYPQMQMASQQYQGSAARWQQGLQQSGPQAGQVVNQFNKVQQALDVMRQAPGYNMASAIGGDSAAKILKSGGQASRPMVINLPAYNISSSYSTNFSASQTGSNSVAISGSQSVNANDFGQSSTSFNYPQLVEGSDVSGSNIEITLTFDDMKAVDIQPGQWFSSLSKFGNVGSNAPQHLANIATPLQAIIVSQLGFKINFGSGSNVSFNNGDTVRVLGVMVKIGSGGRDDDNAMHSGEWDKGSNTLTVTPIAGGVATVVGMVGEKA